MKILLIFPNYLENFYLVSASFYPPLGLAVIAGILEKNGHDVSVIDATAERMNIHRLEGKAREVRPDIIGITANVAFARKAMLTGQWLKARFPNIPIIFGGPWPTTRYEVILTKKAGNFVVIGEGDETIVDLVRAIEENLPVDDVKGIAFMKNGQVLVTDKREFICNLDKIPFPPWELFPKCTKYFWNPKGKIFYPVMTSRGCPYGCINCTKLVHGFKLRTRSIENVIEEIKYLRKNFHADEVIIIDDAFNVDIERAEQICDEIASLPFKINLRFTNGLRADKITPRLAWKLKNAGAYDIVLGIESGNQRVVNKIGKNLDLQAVRRAVIILKHLGILVSGFFMVGLPPETIKTMIDTKILLKELDLDMALISRVIPFPGTKLYEIVNRDGQISPTFERDMFFYSNKNPAFELPNMPSELIELAFQDLYRTFYFRFSRISKFLKAMRFKNWKTYLNFAIVTIMNIFKKTDRIGAKQLKSTIIQKLKEGTVSYST